MDAPSGPGREPRPPEARPSAKGRPEGRETRKVQLVGGSTFAVSLPRSWIAAVGLRQGDEIHVLPRADGTLLLQPASGRPPRMREARVEVTTKSPEELFRFLIALYLSGTDIVVLTHRAPLRHELHRAVDAACERLLGLQVVDETPTSITLQDLADPQEFNTRKGVRMMHLHAHRMLAEAEASLLRERAPDTAVLQHSENELDRLEALSVKQHNRLMRDLSFGERTGITPEESLDYLLVALNLERIGDYALRVVRALPPPDEGRDHAVGPKMAGACAIATKCVDEAVAAFQREDLPLANATIALSARLGELIRVAPHQTGHRAEAPTTPASGPLRDYARVLESLERIGLYAKTIAEIAINHTVARMVRSKEQEAHSR